MKITRKKLRQLIIEAIGLHGGAGYAGYIYHNSADGPEIMLPVLAQGKFTWKSDYDKMYATVYEPQPNMNAYGARKGKLTFGNFIYKLKVNFYGALIFNKELAQQVYGENWRPEDQVLLITGNQHAAERIGQIFSNTEEINRINPMITQSTTVFASRHYDQPEESGDLLKMFKFVVDNSLTVYVNDVNAFLPVAWKEESGPWISVGKDILSGNMSNLSTGFFGRPEQKPGIPSLDIGVDSSKEQLERTKASVEARKAREEAERLERNRKARERREARKNQK